MAMFVGLDVSLRTTSICIVEADGSLVWEGKAESEPASLIKALTQWRGTITLVGIEACPLSEWLYGVTRTTLRASLDCRTITLRADLCVELPGVGD
jgi:hypothetical protein